jgi:hypothetical protein
VRWVYLPLTPPSSMETRTGVARIQLSTLISLSPISPSPSACFRSFNGALPPLLTVDKWLPTLASLSRLRLMRSEQALHHSNPHSGLSRWVWGGCGRDVRGRWALVDRVTHSHMHGQCARSGQCRRLTDVPSPPLSLSSAGAARPRVFVCMPACVGMRYIVGCRWAAGKIHQSTSE